MAESLSLGSFMVEGGFAERAVCITSSHFCSAEKQFRYPLEFVTNELPHRNGQSQALWSDGGESW